MPPATSHVRYRFGVFEADPATGELRKQGIRIKLNVQPFRVLLLLLERPHQILTRDEIASHLWPQGTFVDFEHGVNSAVNRIREALGDKASNPRFIETLARRGYRFIAPVERVELQPRIPETIIPAATLPEEPESRFLVNPADLPPTPRRTVQTIFVCLQLMYLGFYVGALANLPEIAGLFLPLAHATETLALLVVTATLLIPVRVFLLSAVLFRAPQIRRRFLRLWPFLLVADVLWSLSPFLLLHHIDFGLALAFTAPLVYSPFAQRALILMGAGEFSPTHPRL